MSVMNTLVPWSKSRVKVVTWVFMDSIAKSCRFMKMPSRRGRVVGTGLIEAVLPSVHLSAAVMNSRSDTASVVQSSSMNSIDLSPVHKASTAPSVGLERIPLLHDDRHGRCDIDGRLIWCPCSNRTTTTFRKLSCYHLYHGNTGTRDNQEV